MLKLSQNMQLFRCLTMNELINCYLFTLVLCWDDMFTSTSIPGSYSLKAPYLNQDFWFLRGFPVLTLTFKRHFPSSTELSAVPDNQPCRYLSHCLSVCHLFSHTSPPNSAKPWDILTTPPLTYTVIINMDCSGTDMFQDPHHQAPASRIES